MTQPPNARSWPSFWDKPVTPQDAEHAIWLLKCARSRRSRQLEVLARTGNVRRAKRLGRKYLMSFSARLACLAMAVERKLGSARDRDAAALAIVEAADYVDPWMPAAERAKAFPREKMDGGVRYVFSFGIVDYARQLLIRDLAAALTSHEPTQFMSAGGRPRLEEWLRVELPAARSVITTDIPSCFDRVLREAVDVGLPLPRRVKEEVLYRPMDRAIYLEKTPQGLTPMKETVAQMSSPKRGIPQGSAASSVASERVIARIIRRIEAVSADARVATFGDNLIILLRDPDIEQSVYDALFSEVEACFGPELIGELIRRTKVGPATRFFSFAGRDYRRQGRSLKVRLSEKRIDKFVIATGLKIEAARMMKDRQKLVAADRSLQAWLRQNIQFPGALDQALTLAAQIRGNRLYRETVDGDDPPLVEAL